MKPTPVSAPQPGSACSDCGCFCFGEAIVVDVTEADGVRRTYLCRTCAVKKPPRQKGPLK